MKRSTLAARKLKVERLEARKLLTVVADSYEVQEDASLVAWGEESVVANDTDVSQVVLGETTENGLLLFNKSGEFGYRPNANFSGEDTFTYRDVNAEEYATVTITVTADDSGVDAVDDAYTVLHDSILRVRNNDEVLMANDTNVTKVSLSEGPEHGSVSLSPNGKFNYIPDDYFAGEDSFTYIGLNGQGGADIATVTITVTNETPVAVDDAYTTEEDKNLNVTAVEDRVLANDTDADGDSLTAVLETGPENGTVELKPGGKFLYVPNADFNGSDTFTYKAFDGIDYSNVATVTITITPVNDAPVGVEDTYEAVSNETLVVGEPGVLGNDTDVDGDTLTATLVSEPTKGTLILNANGSFAYEPEISETDYTATFKYAASDGELSSGETLVTINVTGVVPVINDDQYEILENTTYAASVLENDENVTDKYTITIKDDPDHGTFIFDNSDGSFIYSPDADFTGQDTFSYVVSADGFEETGDVIINIRADVIAEAIYLDEGFKASNDVTEAELDEAAGIVRDMNSVILEAITKTEVFQDNDISVQDLFALNQYVIANYMSTDTDGNPLWVDANGNEVTRDANTANDYYYVGQWADWHGDDANGRREYGTTGDNIEHGYHLIQNDGGTTTLDGAAGNYTLNYAGGDGRNLWTTVEDGILHMGFDIVSDTNGTYAFADDYEAGVDYYFLNEDADRNESLNDVADWLTYFLLY